MPEAAGDLCLNVYLCKQSAAGVTCGTGRRWAMAWVRAAAEMFLGSEKSDDEGEILRRMISRYALAVHTSSHPFSVMDRLQIDRLRDTLDSLVSIRSNMETILRDLSVTQSEMQQKLSQAKRKDATGTDQRLVHILKQQTDQMSQSVDQLQHHNEQLTTAVKSELGQLLQKSSHQKDRIVDFASEPPVGQAADRLLAAAQLLGHDNDDDADAALDAEELNDDKDDGVLNDAHDLTGEQNTQNSSGNE